MSYSEKKPLQPLILADRKLMNIFPRPTINFAAGAAIGLFLLFGLLHLRDYSQTPDENRVMERGRLSWQLAKQTFGLSPNLTPDQKQVLSQHFHPPLFGMINIPVSNFARTALHLDPVESLHLLPLLWSTLGLAGLFFLSKRLFNPEVALFSVTLMILFPRFIAHAQYNPKDVPLMMAAVVTLLRFHIALENKTLKNILAAGAHLGATCSLGLNGFLLIPIVMGASILDINIQSKEKKAYESSLKMGGARFLILLLSSAFLTCWVTWPQLWTDPLYPLRALLHFANSNWFETGRFQILWFGNKYAPFDLPWGYIPINIALTTPILTLVFSFVGIFVSLLKINRKNMVLHFLLLSWLFLPILIRCRSGIIRYNEMRHVFISVPPLMIYSALGLFMLAGSIRNLCPQKIRGVAPLGIILFFVYLWGDAARWHPFEGSYYNEIVRFMVPRHIEDKLLISPWGVTCRQATDWINQNAENGSTVCIQCEGDVSLYSLRKDLIPNCELQPQYTALTSDMLSWNEYNSFNREKAFYKEDRLGSSIFYVFKRGTHGF